jgi:hypothetical protein
MAKKCIPMEVPLFLLAFNLFLVGCGGGSVTVEKLGDKLGKMKPNTADTPYTIKLDATVNITAKMGDIYKAVKSEGKYIILDLSACTAKDNTIDNDSGFSSFNDCEYIKGIILPKTLTTIGYAAFSEWQHLAIISIPSGVTSIGIGAFYRCGLRLVTIPSSVIEIGVGAFSEIPLAIVTFVEGSNIPGDKFGNVAFPPSEMSGLGFYYGSNALRDAYLANGSGTYAFDWDNKVWTKK